MCPPVTRNRICAAVLAGAFLMSATACGSDDDTTPAAAGNAPAATTAAPAATTAAAAPSDKELCETAQKADKEMRQKLVETLGSGKEPEPSFYGNLYTEMADRMKNTGDGAVADAMNEFAAGLDKAAAAKDPGEAGDNPAVEKAGAKITAACKAAGVPVNF